MKKETITGLVLIFLSLSAFGQGIYHHPEAFYTPAPAPDKYYHDSIIRSDRNTSGLAPIRYNISIGTSFSSSRYFGSGFQSWIAPELNYRISDRLHVRAGVIMSHSTISKFPDKLVRDTGYPNSWVDFLVYGQADYKLSEDLVISGSVMKSIDQTPDRTGFRPSGYGFESYSMSFHYRISNNIQIGAQIRFDRGFNPYLYQPARPFGYRPDPWGPWH